VEKVGTSNPDRTINLKGCSKVIIIIIIINIAKETLREAQASEE
jgi:hypothetical protein